ncbi:hypothetical protein ASD60_23320 [Pseudomonas sp. Root562]|nr:hypothetical protein ASD60_23320 [Pseudomonas sp. Root562]
MPTNKPEISRVTISTDRKPTVSGTYGHSSAYLEIFFSGGIGGAQLTKTLTSDGSWSVSATTAWPIGRHTITAKQTFKGQPSGWAVDHPFEIKPPQLGINQPASPAEQNLAIGGNGLYAGATATMLDSSNNRVPGTFTPNGERWTFTPNPLWAPGERTIKAVQTFNGVESTPSVARTFKIRPPQLPAIRVSHLDGGIVRLSGTAFNAQGTLVHIHYKGNNPGPFPDVPVSNGNWSKDISGLAPDRYSFDVQQSVPDASGGRIKCTAWTNVSVIVKPPKPSITPPPVPAAAKQVLTVTNVYSGTVALAMFTEADTRVAGDFIGSGTTRTFTPTADWALGTKVKVVQTVSGVASDPSQLCTIAVKPPKPVITPPPIPAAAKQVLTITQVYSGTVTLVMFTEADTRVAGDFIGSGTTRTFTPTADWPLGTKVKVVQTVSGVSSAPSELCTIAVKPPKPAITPPPTPAEVKQVLTITNVSSGTVALEMFNERGFSVIGTFSPTGTIRTFTPDFNWASGTSVKVVQTFAGAASDPSELCTIAVKPSPPVIISPPIPAAARQMLTITRLSSGYLEPAIFTEAGEPVVGHFFGEQGPTIAFAPSEDWALGTRVKAVQTVAGVSSDPSDVRSIAVKPPKPAISPLPIPAAAKQVLTITNVFSGAVTLAMFNEVGDTVVGNFVRVGTAYTFTPTEDWALGTKVKVVQTVAGASSDPSELCAIPIKPPKPVIIPPPIPASSRQVLTITNVFSGDVELAMFTEDGPFVGGKFSRRGDDYIFEKLYWSWEVGNKVRVVQTVAGAASDPSEWCTVAVKPPQPKIQQPYPPVAAQKELVIHADLKIPTTLAMYTETGVPVVGIFRFQEYLYIFTPTFDWSPGTNSVYVVQTVATVESDPSEICTFTVADDKPRAPQFELPPAGLQTPTRPIIKVTGSLPRALITVRLEESETLHSDTADAEGILEFKLETPLVPGSNALQVKQKGDGPESDWSEPHRFTVKQPPGTPVIDRPTCDSQTLRKPKISGTGVSGGKIHLRHLDNPDVPFATVNGVRNWSWNANEEWDIGTYTIQAQQTADDDGSEWTQPRTFSVVESLYGFGDVGPVLAQPVVSNRESVLLRVQVVSGETGESVEGVKVEWRVADTQAVRATTVTDPDGWARYLYTPDTAGEHIVVADLSNENQGVEMTERFEVTALPDNVWAPAFELYLEGEKVDLAKGDLALLQGKTHELALKVTNGSPLIGSSVALEDLWESEALALKFEPPLGTPQPLEEGQTIHWSIICDPGKSGYFGLILTSQKLPDWQLPGRVIARDFNEEVDLNFDTFVKIFGGTPAYPCIGATHTVTIQPKARSLLLGKDVILEVTEEATGLGVVVSPEPNIPQRLGIDGVSWTFNCVASTQSGSFSVRLRVPEWDLSSSELEMSLGHNKVKIIERDGPREIGGAGGRWRTGVCAASEFTAKVVAVPVTVHITGKEPGVGTTDIRGWIYVYHGADESVSFTFHNRYDGSIAS